jgi:hypothetical protein
MTEDAPDPDTSSTSETPKRRRWPLIVGAVSGLIVIAIGGWRLFGREHVQHLLAFLGTLTAVIASGVQGKRAKTKSEHHRELSTKPEEASLKSAHDYDADHFEKVSFLWYIFLLGAIAAAAAELIDWWGKPFKDLSKFI